MTEGNTCYRGDKPGVSDVFAGALWAANYSLLLGDQSVRRYRQIRRKLGWWISARRHPS
jgi:hypothetical protein